MAPPTGATAPDVDGDEPNNSRKSRKGKKKGEDNYVLAARTIARCIDLWCDVDKIIKTMRLLQQDEASKHGEFDEDDAEREVREECLRKISPEAREYSARTYYKIIQIAPSLRPIIEDPSKFAELTAICSKMNTDIKGTRSSDATHLKSSIPRYCLPNPYDPTSLSPPIINGKGRAEMGLNHPVLARWLCPADQLEAFDEDPEQARKDLASGAMPMGSEDFPSFFWSEGMPGEDFNPQDMLHGFLKSYPLIRVNIWLLGPSHVLIESSQIARHIFLGPSHAITPPERKNRSCNAVLNDVTTIEPEHIAYVCIQARFGISSKDQWNEMDGNVNYCDMYKAIIRFLQDAVDKKWKDGLLRWWNKEIFGNENGRASSEKATMNNDSGSAPRMSTMERLRAQMAARLTSTAAPDDFSHSVLDPSLRSTFGATSRPHQSDTSTSSTEGSSAPSVGPAGPSEGSTSGSSPAGPRNTLPASSTAIPVPATPRPATVAPVLNDSPLSDEDGSIPLTPVTNRRGKQGKSAKAMGKRPAPPDAVDNEALTSRGKKSKRTRK
ncbi:hypothetical protein JVT61DRAFT_14680 [Boletus reticuloceps]|uniref:Uncharacterized protein n=2 Tax=Boletus reticuloceps TaxID=495285 RepID=A0A8I2YVW4_9AGAM|nr:hypothetical protein JVT61DRAFT_14680 [Boletus reticuloceps]